MLRFGPDTGPVVVVALPLFEEANRTRAFAVSILRALAERGIAGALPDLPGQGESLTPTHQTDLAKLGAGFAAAVASLATPIFTLAIRSGALLDADAQVTSRYHLSPMTGADLRRELVRARQASARESGENFDPTSLDTATDPVELAGNLINPALLAQLTNATPSLEQTRTVRLATEAKPADAKLPGSPLWRRAEPDNDPAFAKAVADDIAEWIATCVA
ncbi:MULTISPECIES: hypothetical protein [unclassified Sphingomonas]|uniref:hypothetical protein n=1 Tax=unclassified Sphingomonas TaxID=196159 RepID=UPI0021516E4B|nr:MULTISPECIES: hypothetical protein [unclassified Sphingomonas]MCR5871960.1 hypothetical protein [Sphingomonas sp. J344]UUX99761.1 hypothetical protein LRS08_00910 [Sphingomonas sp. J315]